MFFAHLPIWANFIILALALVAGYFVVNRIEKTTWYANLLAGKHWMAMLNIVSGLHAVVTAGLLFVFAGFFWSIVLGIGDGALHWVVGYWKLKKAMPKVDDGNIQDAEAFLGKIWKWIAALHVSSYVGLATYVIDYVQQHPETFKAVLAYFHITI